MQLTSFSPSPSKVETSLLFSSQTIKLSYDWKNLQNILLPKIETPPQQKDELWKKTCFEFFIKKENSKEYYEFNFSPNRCWRCYLFTDYRKKQKTVSDFQPKSLLINQNSLDVEFLNPIKQRAYYLIQISAVIEDYQHGLSYYALNHASKQPDFHCQKSFVKVSHSEKS